MSEFEYNTRNAKIQGLSVDMYKDNGSDTTDTLQALEAYKSLRRLLPMDYGSGRMGFERHLGATAAHKATQGVS